MDYISQMLNCMKTAINSVPELFEPVVESILEQLVLIVTRSAQQTEADTYMAAMQCVIKIALKHADKTSQ